jgi:hypothetical protein
LGSVVTPGQVRQRPNRALAIKVLEPPLGEYADRIEYWWRAVFWRTLLRSATNLGENRNDNDATRQIPGLHAL